MSNAKPARPLPWLARLREWATRHMQGKGRLKASDPTIVFELNKLLPPQGENRSRFVFENGTLTADIFFDSADDRDASIRIVFDGVASFCISTMPGIDITHLNCARHVGIGSLIEFQTSAAARAWTKYLHWHDMKTRHFSLVLLEEGKRLEVFAEQFRTEH